MSITCTDAKMLSSRIYSEVTHSPVHVHKAVHVKLARTHEHLDLHPSVQPHRTSSRLDFVTSGSVVQYGCHPSVVHVQPQSCGLGSWGLVIRA